MRKEIEMPEIRNRKDLTNAISYQLWEDAGRPFGNDEGFWFESERIMSDELNLDMTCDEIRNRGYICCHYASLEKVLVLDDLRT